jgi:carboxylesterase
MILNWKWWNGMVNKIGCLIIHGFGGNIEEIKPLKQYLDRQGFTTICPQLKGHTGRRRDLGKYGYTDWIESAE